MTELTGMDESSSNVRLLEEDDSEQQCTVETESDLSDTPEVAPCWAPELWSPGHSNR